MYDIIFNVLNSIFGPFVAYDPNPANPIVTVLVISFLVSLLTTIANKLLVDQEEMNQINSEMKEFQNKLREAQKAGDGKELARLQSQQGDLLQKQSKMMTNSFKPMLITFIPIILIFWWMRASVINSLVIHLPPVVYWITLTPMWHFIGHFLYGGNATIPYGIGWLLWYMICTMGTSQILRKYFGFESQL